MIPAGWTTDLLANLVDYSAGRTPARANVAFWDGDGQKVPWVAISDMENYGTVAKTKEGITSRAFDDVFRRRIVPAGTLIMSFKLTIGRVSTLGVDACHNEAIISIKPKRAIEQRYLGYFLSQVDFDDLQDRQIKGNTLNQDKIDRININFPSKNEQFQIADVLDQARRAIELETKSLEAASALKRATMREVFTRGLRGEAQKETEIGLIPESWDVVSLGSLGKIGNGSTPKKDRLAYWTGGTYPWLTSSKVYDRQIVSADQFVTDTALRECHLPRIEPGAILIAITGQGKTLGHCAVLRVQATINQHIAYVATNTDRADPSFIRGYIETQYDYLRQVGSGGGSTKGALTCAFLRDLPVPLPPLGAQEEIVEILNAVDRKIDLHKRKRVVLEELFKALLHKLMTGEIRVSDLDLSALKVQGAG
jgi:type I restriction enzyme, S subunit